MRVAVDCGSQVTELEVPDERLIALEGAAPGSAIADAARAVADAIEAPLEFPPLRQAVVPGDHVAIVLDEGVPRPGEVLGPLVECLVDAGVQPRDIPIVEVPAPAGPRNGLTADTLPPGIGLVQHNPLDRSQLSYLASTKAGTRVYLNRAIVDADLVVLVGRVDYHPILGYRGTSSSVFPGLADDDAGRRFRSQIKSPPSRSAQAAARRETDEVAWLLGVQFAIQLVLGRHNEVIAVLAGQREAVQRKSQQLLDAAWRCRAARRAGLVVAGISGSPAGQGFQQLGAVLAAASRLVQEGGRIVVLSSIDAEPGPALRSAQQLDEPGKVLDHVRRHPVSDAISTWQIAEASQHARVYLLSRMADGLVEDLFMIPIATAGEVQRLVDQARSCLIVHDAQLACATVEGEDEKPA